MLNKAAFIHTNALSPVFIHPYNNLLVIGFFLNSIVCGIGIGLLYAFFFLKQQKNIYPKNKIPSSTQTTRTLRKRELLSKSILYSIARYALFIIITILVTGLVESHICVYLMSFGISFWTYVWKYHEY